MVDQEALWLHIQPQLLATVATLQPSKLETGGRDSEVVSSFLRSPLPPELSLVGGSLPDTLTKVRAVMVSAKSPVIFKAWRAAGD